MNEYGRILGKNVLNGRISKLQNCDHEKCSRSYDIRFKGVTTFCVMTRTSWKLIAIYAFEGRREVNYED